MTVLSKFLSLETQGNGEIVNITDRLTEIFAETGLQNGILTVFVAGSTGAITTVEFEPGLVNDLKDLWEHIASSSDVYQHDRAWGDGNGHSHIRASLVGPSLTIPFVRGKLTLGTWQQVVFIEFDVHPRSRELVLQFMGEA